MLPRGAILGATSIAIIAFYCRLWNVHIFKKPHEHLILLVAGHREAQEPVVRFLGQGFFFIAAAAWVVLCLQSIAAAVQRARYRPLVRQALQPVSEEVSRQQAATAAAAAAAAQQPSSSAASPASNQAKATQQPPSQAQRQQQQQHNGACGGEGDKDWRDHKRLRTLEAAQRALDEQAAALRAAQEQEEEAKKARKAQAAEAAARKKAEREAAEAAARVATAAAAAAATREAEQRRALWNQAVSQQWHGLEPPRPVSNQGGQEPDAGASSLPQSSSTMAGGEGATSPSQGAAAAAQGGAGVDAATAAAVAAAQLEFERDIRQQQDREYQQSLERDRARKAQQEAQRRADEAALRQLAQQRQLAALRQTLQADLPPEPPSSDPALTLRVRLPGGANASRRFRPSQGFEEVFAWVYGLGDMPLWPPGSWALVSSFPRRQLAPPSSSQWAPGVWEQQQQQGQGVQEEVLLPGEWLLRVNRLTEGPLWVKVHADTTVQEVKDSIMAQTGTAPEQQRLIYSGQILYFPHRSMQQLRIGEGHSLQLAVRDSSAGSGSGNGSSGGGSAAAAAPAAATGGAVGGDREASQRAKELGRAAEHSYLGAGDVLVVSSVAELQEQVAAGAALLALYVEALQPKQQ